jgi:hypothetical protein
MFSERKKLPLLFFAAALLVSCSTAVAARDEMSIHVLFTGDVSGAVEPIG